MNEWMKRVNEWMNEWMNEKSKWMNEWMNEKSKWMNEWMKKIFIYHYLSKLHTLLDKTLAWKIVETVPSTKISKWNLVMETNGLCSSSSKISTNIFRPFTLINLKQFLPTL